MPFAGRRRSWWNSTNGTCACSASADRAGDWTLTLVVIAAVLLLAFVPAERLAWWLMPLIAANTLIGLLIGRSFVEHAFLVACYARERR